VGVFGRTNPSSQNPMTAPLIDPSRTDLAAEYRARPFGRHSPELQAVLDTMRRAENCQNLILVGIGGNRWMLGERLPDGQPPRLFTGEIFTSLEDGEWAAFKRRWRGLAGSELVLP
jgi:N,N-dimethylformamidase